MSFLAETSETAGPRTPSSAMDPVLRRMEALVEVSAGQRRRVEALARRIDVVEAKSVLQTEGDAAVRPRYILSGWACRQRILSDGRRQIFGLLMAGDSVGVCPRHHPLTLTTTVALTRLTTVDAAEILSPEVSHACPELARALRMSAVYQEALLLDHLVRLGRQTAYERVGHFLLELQDRMEVVEPQEDGAFALPVTQEVLADALGLSMVHMNRTLQQLRRERLIEFTGGKVRLLDVRLLATISDYSAPTIPV